MPPVRIIFAGTSLFSTYALKALTEDPAFEVSLVITQPDKPTGRSQELTPPPIKTLAQEKGIKVWQPQNINKEFQNFPLSTFNFPLLVVVSFGQILSQEVLDWPKTAPVNVHASLLPRWRGASPIQHAILSGDAESGVTVQRMVRELDAGPILAQEQLTLDPRETAVTLHDRLAAMGADLLMQTLKAPLDERPQPTDGVTICRKLTRKDGIVDPATMTAQHIDRTVRALTPWPGVTVTISGQPLKILQTSLEATADATPLSCANGTTLYLEEVQPPGKKPMSGAAWERGRRT